MRRNSPSEGKSAPITLHTASKKRGGRFRDQCSEAGAARFCRSADTWVGRHSRRIQGRPLNFSTVVSPVQQCLPLFRPAFEVSSFAILFNLGNMPLHRLPPLDLAFIIRASPAHVVSAIPLKPASGIFMVNPTLLPPHRERLRGIDSKPVQGRIVALMAELCIRKPVFGKLVSTVAHVPAAEDPHLQHLFRGQFR